MANSANYVRKFMQLSINKVKPLISAQSVLRNYKDLSYASRSQLNLNKTKYTFFTQKFGYSSSALDQKFSESQKLVTTLNEEPDNDVKLKLYSLFKQGTVGKCNVAKPGALDFVGKAKWQAWNSLGDISQEEAKKQYVDTVQNLIQAQNQNASSSNSNDQSSQMYDGLKVTNEKGLLTILLNRPQKKNAITADMYRSITKILNDANNDDSVALLVIRGAGDYFCSGNDLSNFLKLGGGDVNLNEIAEQSSILLKNFVDSYINFSKPIIGIVNGPAIGIAVTVLGLFDFVYASDKATFHTPFSALGQSPEGCSSYTFPRLMGSAKANEILMLNKKVTAADAKNLGLVTEVFPADRFDQEVEKILAGMMALPKLSLIYAKQLSRNSEIEILRKVNIAECERLRERWVSDDCKKAIMGFFQGKSKM